MLSQNVKNSCVNNHVDFTIVDLKCITFNCHSFKQSSEYVIDNIVKNDVVCLTETWRRPHETDVIRSVLGKHPSTCKNRFTVFSKSGMVNCEPDYAGRPFGGVAIVVKHNPCYSAREIDIPTERATAIGLYDRPGNLVQVLVCVYLPFLDKSNRNCTLTYVDVIDKLQSVIDMYASTSALTIMGDFNAQLPTAPKLNKNWHKINGFTKHSSILYDFITSNDMCAADLIFPQTVEYTFSAMLLRISLGLIMYSVFKKICVS